jgi:hypothetical protein
MLKKFNILLITTYLITIFLTIGTKMTRWDPDPDPLFRIEDPDP